MNKEKLKFLAFNIFLNVPTFMIIQFLLVQLVEIDNFASSGIAFCIYLIVVVHSTEIDYHRFCSGGCYTHGSQWKITKI